MAVFRKQDYGNFAQLLLAGAAILVWFFLFLLALAQGRSFCRHLETERSKIQILDRH